MVQHGIGLDTPRTNLGDATYLGQPDFDISQEQSFQSPSKDNNNLLQQLQAGRRGAIKTPGRNRGVLADRKNNQNAFGGGEFTPLLKSATRNSALRLGKENGIPRTPAFLRPGGLDNVAEELSPVPMGSSVYGNDTRMDSYMAQTPIPHIDSSSAASTPMALLPRRGEAPGVLQDGNQLSLREQENVIDRIEKENFGLKLKIHFLEEALRKAGPGFSEAALKENTELKVDKVTMQKELHTYKRNLGMAERDLESLRLQVTELQEKSKRRHTSDAQNEELDRVRSDLGDKEDEVRDLRRQLEDADRENADIEKLRDELGDLEADYREKERTCDDREDEIEALKAKLEDNLNNISELEDAMKTAQRRVVELEEQATSAEELADAQETIEELEADIKRLKTELEEANDERLEAVNEKNRAEADLEELQDEMANKSVATKGLSRQIEEKNHRLQDELEDMREKYSSLQVDYENKEKELRKFRERFEDLSHDNEVLLQQLRDDLEATQQERDTARAEKDSATSRLCPLQDELKETYDAKNLLQTRHDALKSESSNLQRDLAAAQKKIEALEDKLESNEGASGEREKYKSQIERLNDDIEDLKAEIREKERLYDDDNDKWNEEKRSIEAERERAEERAAGLQRTIDRLQASEGTLSSKEAKMQEALNSEKERHQHDEALLSREIEELNTDVQSRRQALDDVRTELSNVKEELRIAQREQRTLAEKAEGLEDEVLVLQSTYDEESEHARNEANAARQEADSLKQQLKVVRQDLAKVEVSALGDIQSQLSKLRHERQSLQEQVNSDKLEMHALRSSVAEAQAERDELESQVREMRNHEEETFRMDQDKIDLRTSKLKLENEVRRLRDEKSASTQKLHHLEQDLQEEINKANVEESRLNAQITEYIQREADYKDVVRNLKRQISDLEHKTYEDVSQHAAQSLQSMSGSTRKSELVEARRQLSIAHQTIKDLRSQIRETEREASKRHNEMNSEIQAKTDAWEDERDDLQAQLNEALRAKEELSALNTSSEASMKRLRSKIERLERELQAERRNNGEDRTMALERRDLHDMLRETQIQAEELELIVKERDATIAAISMSETQLRNQISRIRDERATQRDRALNANSALASLEEEFRTEQEAWEREKKSLVRGVRFPNMSLSHNGGNESLLQEAEEREKRHIKELRGLVMQIEWLRARCKREEGLRADAAFAKKFMLLQVELFGACNAADLQILQQMGITPDKTVHDSRPSLRSVAFMVMAGVRMRKGAAQWAKHRKVHERLVASVEVMRRKEKGKRVV